VLLLFGLVVGRRVFSGLSREFEGELVINDKDIYPLYGSQTLYLVRDANNQWALLPHGEDPKLSVRCISRGEIEVQRPNEKPRRLKFSQRYGAILYRTRKTGRS